MISTSNITLRVGKKALFEDVNIKFTEGNCYGLIGANGAGKSTFLKILSGQLEPTKGEVIITPGERLSFLQQDHFKYDEFPVLDTVMMGNARLYEIMKEKEAIYAKEDFTDEDGIKASELEGEFAAMNGWEAESDAATLLNGLGIATEYHYEIMKNLNGPEKVKVLLAQALFGNPDILLLDEPTNHLDLDAIAWLEEFLINFDNTVIVVSHDRYFLNKVCTQIADIDYGKIKLYAGNYDFWYESSQLLIRQMKEANKKKEEKIKELQEFISRFSANASKSKQATSRKRALEKIQLDDIQPSSRKYPYIDFRPNRSIGNDVLSVEGLSKTIDGEKVLDNISFTLNHDDKVAFVGGNELAKTTLFQILMGEMEPDEGVYKWGITTSQSYFPLDFGSEFDNESTIVEWLTQYSDEKDATYVRGFLGRMLFGGDDGVKRVNVLSGGEKVRCMLSKMMISGSNVLILDEPTNHLDMESITALNNGMIKFPGVLLFSCRDHQIVQTTANRIMEIVPGGKLIDKITTYDEYLESDEMARKRQTYTVQSEEDD
ncbi:MAG: ATP-binding cassette domain-containing protein [Lachnospiraceae bacterium]|nr:ATP-binding cassette domain-containing protein [Dorea sp.]MEE0737489.1 ATP-binding cassette domain-containing protein [Lachnospiraceae bacterium]